MVRTLQLDEWVGEWVAVDRSGHVVAHAQLRALVAEVEDRALFETEIMRAPDPSGRCPTGLADAWRYPYTDFGEGRDLQSGSVLRAAVPVSVAAVPVLTGREHNAVDAVGEPGGQHHGRPSDPLQVLVAPRRAVHGARTFTRTGVSGRPAPVNAYRLRPQSLLAVNTRRERRLLCGPGSRDLGRQPDRQVHAALPPSRLETPPPTSRRTRPAARLPAPARPAPSTSAAPEEPASSAPSCRDDSRGRVAV